jgi:hypothetical protein
VLAGTIGLGLACLAPDTNEPQLAPDPGRAPEHSPLADSAPDAATTAVQRDAEIPAPLPEPAASPEPVPPSPEQIEALLTGAARSMHELGVSRKPIRHLRGPHPEPSGLDAAYAQDRAIGYEGKLAQVREWMALAKFGVQMPSSTAQSGPLARYDLCVTRKGEQAWLHVIVPATGLAEQEGAHYKAESRERWVLLSDHAEPGVDYEPFKRSATPSLARQWGREKVVDDLVRLAREYRDRTGVRLGIGDISHVTGGKMEDHWTHRVGADADVYLLDYSEGGDPRVIFHHWRRGGSVWSERPDGKGEREQPNGSGETRTAERLRALAELVLPEDDVAYFVHNDPEVLAEFDERARARKPGRRFLHARNKGYWPVHDDHVHLRWIDGPLPVGVTPRP